jgi:hypothetical protein
MLGAAEKYAWAEPGFEYKLPYLWNFFPVGMVDGDLVGEDHGFCQRWRSIGGRVWVDPAIQLAHIGHHIYTRRPDGAVLHRAPWAEAA